MSGQNAGPEKCPLQGSEAVNATPTEPCCFTHGIEARDRLALTVQRARLQVGLDTAQAFPRENELADSNQRPGFAIHNLLKLARPRPVAEVLP